MSLPSQNEWSEIYAVTGVIGCLFLVGGIASVVSGLALWIYAVARDILYPSPPTTLSATIGCLVPFCLVALGGIAIKINRVLWK